MFIVKPPKLVFEKSPKPLFKIYVVHHCFTAVIYPAKAFGVLEHLKQMAVGLQALIRSAVKLILILGFFHVLMQSVCQCCWCGDFPNQPLSCGKSVVKEDVHTALPSWAPFTTTVENPATSVTKCLRVSCLFDRVGMKTV